MFFNEANLYVLINYKYFISSPQQSLCRNYDVEKNRTDLLDLNVDCQLMVLDKLDLMALFSLADTNQHFSYLVTETMRRKLQKTKVIITTPLYSNEPHPHYISGVEFRVQHFEIVERMLKKYGQFIEILKIHQYSAGSSTQQVFKLINLHCSKTLREIHMLQNSVDLDMLTNAFEKVHTVSLEAFDQIRNVRPLNETFPSVRRFYLNVKKMWKKNSIECEFKLLEYLDISIFYQRLDGYFNSKQLIVRNPQIRRLKVSYASPKFLKLVADTLLHLEELYLYRYDEHYYAGEVFHFENVKIFTVQEGSVTMPTNISFGKLEQFLTDNQPVKCDRWIRFLECNKQLKKVCVTGDIDNEILTRLTHANLTSQDIFLSFNDHIELESIVLLIQSNQQLNKLTLKIRSSNVRNSVLNILHTKFDYDWIIRELSFYILLERRDYY